MTKNNDTRHVIPMAAAGTLDGLFRERVKRTPDIVAYKAYNEQHGNWRDYTWAQVDRQVARWQAAMEKDGLQAWREIREPTPTRTIPVILLTARADEGTKLAALDAEFPLNAASGDHYPANMMAALDR